MKVESKREISLILTEKEAFWLKGLIQNYMGRGEEPAEHQIIRSTLWHCLDKAGIKCE
jgi:hypothetical protein